ncbi:uncharacterized protein K489DRAFT_266781 [Dissoconium aciculare CBS 342.82]|jgi:hypothetical protein|uniref:Uncharacterized protein n=1 Tax=Dissoconium aciculare CBS 342.82 TaxID=1314786 RepID=A0A6J3LZC8_9PEZI|nr:uncharacterized protein K489DRAFT_266781 [Dissoconium aciculare CBS 342.82]KAF1821130.1 hypothetical protein K489DRAFT_266781 [Dissoconium aciculare CBS 342.82]
MVVQQEPWIAVSINTHYSTCILGESTWVVGERQLHHHPVSCSTPGRSATVEHHSDTYALSTGLPADTRVHAPASFDLVYRPKPDARKHVSPLPSPRVMAERQHCNPSSSTTPHFSSRGPREGRHIVDRERSADRVAGIGIMAFVQEHTRQGCREERRTSLCSVTISANIENWRGWQREGSHANVDR